MQRKSFSHLFFMSDSEDAQNNNQDSTFLTETGQKYDA